MVVAWSADHQHEDCTLSHDRQVRNPVYGQNLFRPNRKPATTPTLFTTRPVSPNTNNQCRGETFFAQIATSNTAYLFTNGPVSPKTTNQCRGEIFFARNATSNTAYPVRNPTRQPQHHLPTCGRKLFRPYNILPICLIPVTTQPLCPKTPATVGARCAGVARPRPPQCLYLAKSIWITIGGDTKYHWSAAGIKPTGTSK